MSTKFMKILKKENCYYIKKDPYFVPQLFFDCGQCFRFKNSENVFTGVISETVVELYEENEEYIIKTSGNISEEMLEEYFDLKRDYKEIEEFLKNDESMKVAMEFGRGIRILKQDFFETLLTFIYSQRSNIPKIAKCVEETAKLFGNKITYKNEIYYTFPTPEQMKGITEKDLESVKCGYRAPYIIDAVNKINSGEINPEELKKLSYEKVKQKLLTIKGVGDKVADCICLFSFGFFDAFPTDTWIKKAMDQLYNINDKDIKEKSEDMFGKYCGIAQQYLFYYLRYRK